MRFSVKVFCTFSAIATVSLLTAHVMAAICTDQIPEFPSPSCGGPYVTCEGIDSSICPDVESCANTLGTYPNKVSQSCEGGGTPCEGHDCRNGEEDVVCYETKPCLKIIDPISETETCSNTEHWCYQAKVTPKVWGDCISPSSCE